MQVKQRTNESHVMQYGDMELSNDILSTFMGSNLNNSKTTTMETSNPTKSLMSVNQRDAKLVYLKHKVIYIYWKRKRKRSKRESLYIHIYMCVICFSYIYIFST